MCAMDVTSRELREGNIRDALRGYNHDDVDELLERAAVTVDNLNARINELTERITKAEGQASSSRETEEQLSRTLLVAQRTADSIVEEARAQAKTIGDEAATAAAARVAEAERAVKAELEEEQRRLKAEVLQLAASREQLDRDVTSLTAFADDLGGRIRSVLESQLAALDNSSVDAGQRPQLADVALPIPDEGVARHRAPAPVAEVAADPEVVALDEDVDAGPPTAAIDAVTDLEPEVEAYEPEAAVVDEDVDVVEEVEEYEEYEEEPAAQDEPVPAAPPASTSGGSALLDERFGLGPARPIESRGKGFDSGEVLEGEVLDDDTFFASLRDAVSDESPLGPREDALGAPQAHGDFFEETDDDESRGLFRRRR